MASADLPRERIEQEAARRGARAFAAACADILTGGDADSDLLRTLAGRAAAAWFVSQDDPRNDYWPRVWAVRGLLWAWDDVALPAVMHALDDDAWRVREMALKVVAKYQLDDALNPAVTAQHNDPVARVRTAATKAVIRLTTPAP